MRFLDDVIGLILPERCAGCALRQALLCRACACRLEGSPRRAWAPEGIPPVWTSASYEGPVRAVITAHKERGRLPLADPLGRALARAVTHALDDDNEAGLALVPVPSGRGSVRRRGHDATLRIARAAARELDRGGTAVSVLEALRQRRRVADQAGLSRGRRAANLAGALAARPISEAPGRVVVVDDVITSGATLREAVRALRDVGVSPLAAATVAATPRLRGR
ncbi:ComF family protein [Spirillospora sp. CA-294931]|uniref:ComF family protein n=1 Tax=Spirillospora sp. CA-294931 TaxID=3240042 RepID=UPI003D8F320C